MKTGSGLIAGAGGLCAVLCLSLAAAPATALTAQECSAKYQAAKTAGTLGGKGWNDFRKAECGADAAAAAAKPDDKSTEAKPAGQPKAAKSAKTEAAATPSAPASPAVFPSAVDPKYAKETAARSRLHTCADQWKINKANNTTGGLRWIQKGGGYWSECNKKLKGA